jgi:hypothetical protein
VKRSSYGRLVSGSNSPSLSTPSSVLRELFCINGINVYRKLHYEASKRKIESSLIEFMVLRIIGSKLGVLLGVLRGSIIRNVSYSNMPNIHSTGNNSKLKMSTEIGEKKVIH